jgi:hypothetical protein
MSVKHVARALVVIVCGVVLLAIISLFNRF